MSHPLGRSPAARAALSRLVRAARPLFFLDLDGTLAPIVDRPEDARVPPATRRLIGRLRASGARVVLVSGRSVAAVRRIAGVPVDAILGDHGARLYQGGRITPWLRADPRQLAAVADRIEVMIAGRPGVRLERKDRSLAIHLRLPRSHAGRVARELTRALRADGLRVLSGHRVLDGQLPGVNKGRAVRPWLRRNPGADAVLYAGDDTTDEDAFRALRRLAVTVAVGPRPRRAEFRTRDPASLARWLARVVAGRESARSDSSLQRRSSASKRGRTSSSAPSRTTA